MRLLLVIPTQTYRAAPFLDAAHRLGVEVVVASDEASSLAPLMQGRHLVISTAAATARTAATHTVAGTDNPSVDPTDGAVALHRETPIDGVVGIDETAALPAARIAARLGLRGSPVAAVAATRDKRSLRARLTAGCLAQPCFAEITTAATPAELDHALEAVGLPCVVKPVDRAGSQGVIRVDNRIQLGAAVARLSDLLEIPCVTAAAAPTERGTTELRPAALHLAAPRTAQPRPAGPRRAEPRPAAPLLIESFIPGAEFALEGLMVAGELHVLALFDKPDPLDGPYFEEGVYVTPSRQPTATIEALEASTRDAVQCLGLDEGPVHAELRCLPGGTRPVVIEIAARSIGGLCSRTIGFEDGSTLEELIVRHAVGLPLGSMRRRGEAAGVLMLPIREAGRLRAVHGVADARAVPGVDGVSITIPPGEALVPLPEGNRYLGFVFAHADDPASVEVALRYVGTHIRVELERADGS